MLKEEVQHRDFTDDAKILAKASAIIRKDMFEFDGFTFSGSFEEQCQEKSVPASLKCLISMILNGVSIENNAQDSQACLSVCQTIFFNSKARARGESKTGQKRHKRTREPPLPLFIGFNIHAMTRSKTLIAKLYQLGLSVSYQRIMELEEMLARSVSERFAADDCVVPACLRKGIFTIGALDNLDHNPSSTTASSSFHGTGISIFQLPMENNPGQTRPPLVLPPNGTTHTLPEKYANVHPVEFNTSSVSVPVSQMKEIEESCLAFEKMKEERWVQHSLSKLGENPLSSEDTLTWAAYHASDLVDLDPPALTALLPLFYEKVRKNELSTRLRMLRKS